LWANSAFPALIAASSRTLNEQLDAWLREQRANVTERTLDGYTSVLKRYVREPLGKKKLASLKASEI
jgi:integrase-like protein